MLIIKFKYVIITQSKYAFHLQTRFFFFSLLHQFGQKKKIRCKRKYDACMKENAREPKPYLHHISYYFAVFLILIAYNIVNVANK